MESILIRERHRPQIRLGAPTLRSLGRRQILALCDALSIAQQTGRALETFDIASNTWGDRPLDRPAFKSDITDDSSPYEFSVAFDGGEPELRLLAEAQGSEGTPLDRWTAGWRLSEELARNFGVSLVRARRVASLFEPRVRGLAFSLWHAASFRAIKPAFRIYFNPQARGALNAMTTVSSALTALGMEGAAAWMKSRFGESEHRPMYFSVDLTDGPTARCKVYLAHLGANADRIESLIAGHGGHQPGDLKAFCRTMTDSDGEWALRPPLTCLAFREGSDLPYTVTLHVPIRCYVQNDAVALQRIAGQLTPGEAYAYECAVRALARRPLDSAAGIQTYASARREDGRKRLTVYLSPEVYSAAPKSAAD